VTLRSSLRRALQVIAIPCGLVASIGLTDALRGLPGPGVALALPLRQPGHQDRASVVVVAASSAVVFGLLALALGSARRHRLRAAVLPAAAVFGCALTLQAVSLQLVRQASLGLDWTGALSSPAVFAWGLGAVLGIWVAGSASSSDRRIRPGPKERPVEGRSRTSPAVRIGS
jgi:hypothetical protein